MTARTGRDVKRPSTTKQSNRAKSGNKAAVSQLSTLADRKATRGRAVLIHGEQSAGKTVLAIAEAPKPLLVLDCDNGLDSVIGVDLDDQVIIWEPSNGIEYTWQDLDYFRNYVRSGDWQHDYQTVVVDNLTAAQKPIIRGAMDEVIARLDPEKAERRDPDVPSQSDWGKIYRMMDEWVRNIRDVKRRGVHVVFTSGTREWLDTDAGIDRIMPDIEGRERNQITTHMDAVGWLEIDDGVRYLHLAPTGAVITKLRLPVNRHYEVPESIENPDFTKMMDIVQIIGEEEPSRAKKKPKTSTAKKLKK